MAKIRYLIFGILFLYACNNHRVSETGIKTSLDSAMADIPVMLDTTFADTAKANDVTIEEEIVTIIYDSVTVSSENVTESSDTVKIVEETKQEEPNYVRLQKIYKSQLGVREKTGKNDGPEVKKYMATVGLGEGYAWCAGFVKWCFLEAGYTSVKGMNGMALSTENKKNILFKPGSVNRKKELRPGDVLTLYYASLKRIGHTGFFDRDVNGTLYESVEGNTNNQNSREGDGVYRRKRSYNSTFSISRWE